MGRPGNGIGRVVIRLLRHDPAEQAYRFFWLMRIAEVDLREHCQRCLIGYKSMVVRTRYFFGRQSPFEIKDTELEWSPSGKYYMCGVTMPYVWKRNFHLAFGYRPGGIVRKTWPGIVVELADAEEYYVKQEYMDPTHPRFIEQAYRTCRNAQFAWGFQRGLYLPGGKGIVEQVDEIDGPPRKYKQRNLFD